MIKIKRPIVLITLGAIIGIILGLYFKTSIAFICIILFVLYFQNKNVKRYLKVFFNKKTICILFLSILIFFTYYKLLEKNYNQAYLMQEQIEITGKIISRKTETEYYNKYIVKSKKEKFILLTDKTERLEYGDLVKIKAKYIKPNESRNYKGFNYRVYLKTQKIYGTLKAENINVIGKKNCNYLFYISNKLQEKIIENSNKILPKDVSSVFLGIILGEKEKMSEELKEEFRISSLYHVLAVSGMHVSFIIIGITFTLKSLKINKKISYGIVIILIIEFMFLTNFTFSVIRAGIMAIILIISKIFYRKADIWTTVSIAILITIIYNPYTILDIGFELSYAGTIGIIYFNKNITRYLEKHINKKMASALAVPISAQILIMPITVLNFNTISVTFLFSNLLASPIVGVIMTFGILIILISLISVKLASFFSIIIKLFINTLILISKSFSKIPFSQIFIRTPSIIVILCYYFSVILVNYIIRIKNKPIRRLQKNLIKKLYGRKIIICVVIVLVIMQIISKISLKEFTIHFIDVGQRR